MTERRQPEIEPPVEDCAPAAGEPEEPAGADQVIDLSVEPVIGSENYIG